MKFWNISKIILGCVVAISIIFATTENVYCTNYTSLEEYMQEHNKQAESAGYKTNNYPGINGSAILGTPGTGSKAVPETKKCDHSYSSKVTRDATCVDLGEVTYNCSKCGATYTEPIPATGKHDYVAEVTKEATCTENGETTYTCSVCGDSYTEEVDATGHKYGSSVAEAATCTTDGTMVYKCEVCDDSYTEVLPALGHTESEPMVTKEAGLFTEGEQITKCTVCDVILSAETIPSRYPVSVFYFGIAAVLLIAICFLALVIKRSRSK